MKFREISQLGASFKMANRSFLRTEASNGAIAARGLVAWVFQGVRSQRASTA